MQTWYTVCPQSQAWEGCILSFSLCAMQITFLLHALYGSLNAFVTVAVA